MVNNVNKFYNLVTQKSDPRKLDMRFKVNREFVAKSKRSAKKSRITLKQVPLFEGDI